MKNFTEAYAKMVETFDTPLVFTTKSGERGTGEYFDAKWAAEHVVSSNVVVLPVFPETIFPSFELGQLAAGS